MCQSVEERQERELKDGSGSVGPVLNRQSSRFDEKRKEREKKKSLPLEIARALVSVSRANFNFSNST